MNQSGAAIAKLKIYQRNLSELEELAGRRGPKGEIADKLKTLKAAMRADFKAFNTQSVGMNDCEVEFVYPAICEAESGITVSFNTTDFATLESQLYEGRIAIEHAISQVEKNG